MSYYISDTMSISSDPCTPNLTKLICGNCHDRFLVIDNKELYWIGASLKDAGRLTFAAAKLDASLIPGLMQSLLNAVSERKTYN